MKLVDRIQTTPVKQRIKLLHDNVDELETCRVVELDIIGKFACHASPRAMRNEYPIIGDLSVSEFDLDMEVFGDPSDPKKPGTYESMSFAQEEEDFE